MGLQNTIISGIDKAFDSLGDLVTAVTLRVRLHNDFDTNVLRTVPKYVDMAINRAAVLDYSATELRDSGILPTDQKVLIKGTDVSTKPVPNHDLLLIDGVEYGIKKVSAAPKNVLYTLQVRKNV